VSQGKGALSHTQHHSHRREQLATIAPLRGMKKDQLVTIEITML